MKKNNILYFIIFASLMVGFNSCKDALDAPTQSSLEESLIYSTPSLAEEAVMGINQSLCETNSYRGRYIPYYGYNTDIEWYSSSEKTTDDRAMLTGYNAMANGGTINLPNDPFSMMYQAIERANLCIRGLREYGNVSSNPELAQSLGEALTLRAMIYFDLIKAWGDVPARFEPISSQTLYLPKSDRDVIYKQILADLKEAEDLVAWPNASIATQTVERANKAFVKGLRARIALSASGYSQRPDGTVRLSNDPELSKDILYPIVKQECLDIIDSKTCKLGSFEENFRNICEENTNAGNESMYEIPFSTGRGRVAYSFAIKHTTSDKYTQQTQGGMAGPLPYVYYDYDNEDVRRDITCIPYIWTNGVQVLNKLSQWDFGKLRYEWMNRVVTASNDDGVNWQVMRYADIYLMAAEAINYIDGPTTAAPYLKEIRSRAFPSDQAKVNAYMASIIADKTTFLNAIIDERGLEFCGEMLRKQDLIRWNLLSSKIAEAKQKMEDLADRTGSYSDLPVKLYYKTGDDGESLLIYGLNHGDTDVEGNELENNGYLEKGWFVSNGTNNLTEDKINSLYINDPDTREFWPIPVLVTSASNGMLINDYGY